MIEEQLRPVSEGAVESRYGIGSESSPARLLADVDLVNTPRFSSGLNEFDRVLGGDPSSEQVQLPLWLSEMRGKTLSV